MSIPPTMRAAVHRRFGTPDVVSIETVTTPVPGPDDVLIRVHSSSVSIADSRVRSRRVPKGLLIPSSLFIGILRPRNRILGMDVAGTIAAVGSGVTTFAVGDRVAAHLGTRFGGHAEFARIAASSSIAKVPDGLDFDAALSVLFGGMTSLSFFASVPVDSRVVASGTAGAAMAAQPLAGRRVLINGASGAVGSMAVQLAKAEGATVTAVTSARNRELVGSLGADRVIAYDETDFTAESASYDVIMDTVGNANFAAVKHVLAPGGTLLLVIAELSDMVSAKRNSKRSGIHIEVDGARYSGADVARLLELTASGAIKPVIERSFELEEIVEAHRVVDSGRKRGTVVLHVR